MSHPQSSDLNRHAAEALSIWRTIEAMRCRNCMAVRGDCLEPETCIGPHRPVGDQ